jgi:hypothetical protein
MPGPWQQEYDCIRWIDVDTNLACIMHRMHQTGTWRAFVGIPPEHPLYLTQKTDTVFQFIDVHNDVTFTGIAPTEDQFFNPPIRRWWIGFHLMGADDLKPKTIIDNPAGEYRDETFVMKETLSLAEQLYGMYDADYLSHINDW